MDFQEHLQKYHCLLTARKIVLAYGGEIKNGVVSNVMSIIDTNLVDETNQILKRKVLHVAIECIQNIERHSDEFVDQKNTSSFLVFKKDADYYVSFCNSICNDKIDTLKQKIDSVNALDKEELNDYYKKALRENTINEKGGAGLGLIEISRRSGNKISYLFEPLDQEYSNFSLMVKISG